MESLSAVQWLEYFKTIEHDKRLNVWHLALLTSLISLAYFQNEGKIIRVSRSRLMSMAHIKTLTTYHKYFKELQDFGFIKYVPSYHPGYKSVVEFFDFDKSIKGH